MVSIRYAITRDTGSTQELEERCESAQDAVRLLSSAGYRFVPRGVDFCPTIELERDEAGAFDMSALIGALDDLAELSLSGCGTWEYPPAGGFRPGAFHITAEVWA